MQVQRPTILLVLKNSKDFTFYDVELIVRHIHGKWVSEERPRIICLWDKVSEPVDLGYMELLPLRNSWPGTWSRMQLYSPEMEQYRPYLYVDLDTAVIDSLEEVFKLVVDPRMFISLEDFWQKGQLATGLAWIPANSDKITKVWNAWMQNPNATSFRMDYFLRKVITADAYWQQLTNRIYDFKPKGTRVLPYLPQDALLVCFHGKPRIREVVNSSITIDWVVQYVEQNFSELPIVKSKATVIIPYKVDRGWLKDAINSVPKNVQLLVSQGEGNWPANFNKVFDQVEGEYVRWLHEDDMLTPNSIEYSIRAIEEQGVDFIHGNAYEIFLNAGRTPGQYIPRITNPTLEDLLRKNIIHSATLMYKRSVFEKLGPMDETLNTAEEYEFNLRCLKAGLRLGYCNTFLAWYRRHPKQKVRVVSQEAKRSERQLVRSMYQ